MKKTTLVLITGATGAIGPVVVKAFHAACYCIRTLSIENPFRGIWPEDEEILLSDVIDVSAVQTAIKGVDMVIHLADLLHMVNPPPTLQENMNGLMLGER